MRPLLEMVSAFFDAGAHIDLDFEKNQTQHKNTLTSKYKTEDMGFLHGHNYILRLWPQACVYGEKPVFFESTVHGQLVALNVGATLRQIESDQIQMQGQNWKKNTNINNIESWSSSDDSIRIHKFIDYAIDREKHPISINLVTKIYRIWFPWDILNYLYLIKYLFIRWFKINSSKVIR